MKDDLRAMCSYRLFEGVVHELYGSEAMCFSVCRLFKHLACDIEYWADLLALRLFLVLKCALRSNANDTASWTTTSVASLLGILVTTLAEIISARVDDDGALWTN